MCEAGRTALLVAAEQGYVDVAATLIELGADVSHADKVMGDGGFTCMASSGGCSVHQ